MAPKDWNVLLKACSQQLRVLRITGKALAVKVLKTLHEIQHTHLVSLHLPELKNSAVSSQDIAKVLRTTPNLRCLSMEFVCSEQCVQALKDALKIARDGGIPLLENLLLPGYYYTDTGMDWQAFATLGKHFPELKTLSCKIDPRYTNCQDESTNYNSSGRALRGSETLKAHSTGMHEIFEVFERLEKMHLRAIGQWQWGHEGHFVQLSSDNFQWFMLRCFNAIACNIKEICIDSGELYYKKGIAPHPSFPALGGVLTRCSVLPHLERLSLARILVDTRDLDPPFSAPKLRELVLHNCGPDCTSAARIFAAADCILDVSQAHGERTVVATSCACSLTEFVSCKHNPMKGWFSHAHVDSKFEHPQGHTAKAYVRVGDKTNHQKEFLILAATE